MSPQNAPTRWTLVTLAKDLGVSRATVSNAYNHPDQLSKQLRARILARAEEVGWAGPDPAGRSLRSGTVGAVGVLVDQSLSYAFSDPATVLFLDGLAQEMQRDGFGLLLHAGLTDDQGLRHVRDAIVDAWVVQSLPDDDPAVAAAQARRRPVVVLDQPVLADAPTISVDDEAGARMAAGHLLDLGHRRLAVLSMPLRPDGHQGLAGAERQRASSYRVMRTRLAGAREAIEQAGFDWALVPVMECASNDPDAGARGTQALLTVTSPPTAIIAFSDQLALGALRAAQENDTHVPDQLSVIGFDDSPLARHANPPLTTVAQPLRERGVAAGRIVRRLLNGEHPSSPVPYPVVLVERASTAPPW
jgi:DNA-binding LacI/PurR family transcriptional regulator